MFVKLTKDLSKYRFGFTEGAICETDMVPVKSPKVTWERVYVLTRGKASMNVTESSFIVMGETEEDVTLKEISLKTDIISRLDIGNVTVVFMKDGKPVSYKAVNERTAVYVPKMKAADAVFVRDYLQEEHLPYMEIDVPDTTGPFSMDVSTKYRYMYQTNGKDQKEVGTFDWFELGDFLRQFCNRLVHVERKEQAKTTVEYQF